MRPPGFRLTELRSVEEIVDASPKGGGSQKRGRARRVNDELRPGDGRGLPWAKRPGAREDGERPGGESELRRGREEVMVVFGTRDKKWDRGVAGFRPRRENGFDPAAARGGERWGGARRNFWRAGVREGSANKTDVGKGDKFSEGSAGMHIPYVWPWEVGENRGVFRVGGGIKKEGT